MRAGAVCWFWLERKSEMCPCGCACACVVHARPVRRSSSAVRGGLPHPCPAPICLGLRASTGGSPSRRGAASSMKPSVRHSSESLGSNTLCPAPSARTARARPQRHARARRLRRGQQLRPRRALLFAQLPRTLLPARQLRSQLLDRQSPGDSRHPTAPPPARRRNEHNDHFIVFR